MTVTVIGIIGLFVRTVHLFKQSTIPDEGFTFWLAAHRLPDLMRLLRTNDFHPPLMYVLAHALLTLTPRAFEFRLIAAAFGALGVVATYFVAQRVVGRSAWLPAVLVALCASLVYFDRFYRMYALLGALSVLAWLLLLRAFEAPDRPWRWVAYGVTMTLLLYTHYLAFFTLGAQGIYALVVRPREWRFWLTAGSSVVLWLPWLPAFLEQLPRGGTAFNQVTSFRNRFILPSFVLTDGLPTWIEFNTYYIAGMWALIVAAIVVAAVNARYRLGLWLALPLGLQITYSVLSGKNLLSQRYLVSDVWALAILMSVPIVALLQTKLRALGAAVAAALIVLSAAGTIDKLFVPLYMAVDWQVYAQFLSQRIQPGDVIVFDDIAPWFALAGSPPLAHRKIFAVATPSGAQAAVKDIVVYPRVWYIDYQSQFSDPDHVIFHALRRTHPITKSWLTTESGYQDYAVTTLFVNPRAVRSK